MLLELFETFIDGLVNYLTLIFEIINQAWLDLGLPALFGG